MPAQPATSPSIPEGKSTDKKEALTADHAELLRRWLSVSESQICAFEVLVSHLPGINKLLDDSFTEISENFVEIAGQLDCYNKKVEIMAARDQSAEGEEALAMAYDISQRVGKLIVSLQFQDRVSQNLVITINVMRAIVEYLQDEITTSSEVLAHDGSAATLDVDFARKLIALFNLGELKHLFVEHLLTHGYIKDPAEVGLGSPDESDKNDDDIDLF